MDVGQVSFKSDRKVSSPPEIKARHSQHQVKRILVPKRENPIVNRLNKTKVEKRPDFKEERDDRLKELRQREQASVQLRVRLPPIRDSLLTRCSRKKRPGRRRSGRKRSTRRITPMTISSPRIISRCRVIRIGPRTGRMTLCRQNTELSALFTARLSPRPSYHPCAQTV